MAFTQDQVNQAYRDSLAQGFNAADIASGAGNLGIDPYMLQLAATASTPAPAGIPQGPNPAYASGYGGYQPEGSKYWGDNPMPESYMQQLPQLDKSTANAVNLALQKAIDAQVRNGYDPESSNIVQTLRGFFSDNSQLRANAIDQAGFYLGSKGQTADYGYLGIHGYENLDTQTPTFKTAFNKDWQTPTLYDMINSSMGWHPDNNNYGDPKNRDAGLNRKLTDDEIRAFQSGVLPASLQAEVGKYRGGTTGGSGGGGSYGSGGYGGGGGGVSLQSYQKNPYLDEMAQGIRRQVNNNVTDTLLPGIRSSAVASGGFGGSRQGVAEGVAMGRASDSLASALANLYGSDYQSQMGRNLQQYGMDQSYALGNKQADNSYSLGMGNLGLGYANLDRSINNDNNSWALQGANLLNSTWNQLNNNNAGAIGAGGNIQNTPINYWQQFGNQANAFGQGYGTSTQSGSGQGNPLLGAAGGWQLGGQLGNMFGGNIGGSSSATQGWTYGGSGTNRGPSGNIDWIYGGG